MERRGFICLFSFDYYVIFVFRGLLPSLSYIMVYRGFYYGLFDFALPYAAEDGKVLGFWRAFCMGQVSISLFC